MIKKVKRTIKRIFGYFGYEIRPQSQSRSSDTAMEIYDTAKMWSKWLSVFPVDFSEIYLKNHEIQEMVKTWLSKETYEKSLWRYGIHTERAFISLNKVQRNITYTDLLVFFSRFLNRTCYLEIGVSAGKNFLQLSKSLKDSTLYGLDIEEINPVIERYYANRKNIWESSEYFNCRTFQGSDVKKLFSLTEYYESTNRNRIYYLCGDKFQEKLWRQLNGEKFTMVFSDACHRPDSIETEMEFMLKNNLIDNNEFIMLWDDIKTPAMVTALSIIFDKLKRVFKDNAPFSGLLLIHGTYGSIHNVGVFISDANMISTGKK